MFGCSSKIERLEQEYKNKIAQLEEENANLQENLSAAELFEWCCQCLLFALEHCAFSRLCVH